MNSYSWLSVGLHIRVDGRAAGAGRSDAETYFRGSRLRGAMSGARKSVTQLVPRRS